LGCPRLLPQERLGTLLLTFVIMPVLPIENIDDLQ